MQFKEYKNYIIFPNGKVINTQGEIVKSFKRKKDGYVRVNLTFNKSRKSFLLHRILASCFLGLEENSKLTVNHKNGKRDDNRLKNLEIITQSENNYHSRINGFRKNKLSKKTVKRIHLAYSKGWTQKKIADTLEVSQTFISKIINKKQMQYAV